MKEIQRVARVHRDPFEPIMPVLEAESPVGEYRKITEENRVRKSACGADFWSPISGDVAVRIEVAVIKSLNHD
ncbi:hypothetical protein [Nitratireductor luteus]|uniref:hypothetical protein n=1 Tax=Nitratireductor luteus TaxID=2976980 RepID=UPI00223FCA3C|nr:hypothetical protein [Nitratireductor luteus]